MGFEIIILVPEEGISNNFYAIMGGMGGGRSKRGNIGYHDKIYRIDSIFTNLDFVLKSGF